jgi:spore coat polysaccharide biosynthesis protein SpsF
VAVEFAALLQARMSSSRLPGKVFMDIQGQKSLGFQINRMLEAKTVSKVVVLTSTDDSDDVIQEYCSENAIECFRGNLLNVFSRFREYLISSGYSERYFFRMTADCPLICSDVIDSITELVHKSDCDYASNTLNPFFPDGLDVELISTDIFLSIDESLLSKYQTEHVTPFIYQTPNFTRLANLSLPVNLSGLRMTLDTIDDFNLIKKILEEAPLVAQNSKLSAILGWINEKGGSLNSLNLRNCVTDNSFLEYTMTYEK